MRHVPELPTANHNYLPNRISPTHMFQSNPEAAPVALATLPLLSQPEILLSFVLIAAALFFVAFAHRAPMWRCTSGIGRPRRQKKPKNMYSYGWSTSAPTSKPKSDGGLKESQVATAVVTTPLSEYIDISQQPQPSSEDNRVVEPQEPIAPPTTQQPADETDGYLKPDSDKEDQGSSGNPHQEEHSPNESAHHPMAESTSLHNGSPNGTSVDSVVTSACSVEGVGAGAGTPTLALEGDGDAYPDSTVPPSRSFKQTYLPNSKRCLSTTHAHRPYPDGLIFEARRVQKTESAIIPPDTFWLSIGVLTFTLLHSVRLLVVANLEDPRSPLTYLGPQLAQALHVAEAVMLAALVAYPLALCVVYLAGCIADFAARQPWSERMITSLEDKWCTIGSVHATEHKLKAIAGDSRSHSHLSSNSNNVEARNKMLQEYLLFNLHA